VEKLHKVISQQMGTKLEDIKPESDLFDDRDIGCDSLDIVELVMAVEEEFNIGDYIPDATYEAWKTVGDIEAYLANLADGQQ